MTQLFPDNYYVLDFETGGLPNTAGFRPIEIAILRFKDGEAKIWSSLVNPFDGGSRFQMHEQAQAIHGISEEDLRSDKAISMQAMCTMSSKRIKEDMPIWTHCGTNFDIKLIDAEYTNYSEPLINKDRWRDTGGLYKGHKLGMHPDDYPNLFSYFNAALARKVPGLKFNLDLIINTLKDIDIKLVKEAGFHTKTTFGEALGFTPESITLLDTLGAHRAAYDVAATHAVVQWQKKNLSKWFEGS